MQKKLRGRSYNLFSYDIVQLFCNTILCFIGPGEYLVYASVCKQFKKYLDSIKYKKETSFKKIYESEQLLDWADWMGYPFNNIKIYIDHDDYLKISKINHDILSICDIYDVDIINSVPYKQFTELIKWSHKNNYDLDEFLCIDASRNDNLEILQWAINLNCCHDDYLYILAIKRNDVKLLRLLLDNKIHFNKMQNIISSKEVKYLMYTNHNLWQLLMDNIK